MNFSYLNNILNSFYPIISSFFNSDYVIFLSIFLLVVGLIRAVMRWSM